MIVVDASAVVAYLVDEGDTGSWARSTLTEHAGEVAAPHHCPYEAGNILRRFSAAGLLEPGQADQAHGDLLSLRLELYPYESLAPLAWRWRHNLTIYDGSYVALAVTLGWPLATADVRLANSPPARRATVLTPEAP